eukprot:gene33218-40191_t
MEEKSVDTQEIDPAPLPDLPPPSPSLCLLPMVRRGEMELLITGVVKKWRPWFFILDKGVLSYYEIEHLYFRDKYDLKGYELVEHYPEDTPNVLRLQHHSKPDIVLRASSGRDDWAASIAEHTSFLRSARLSVLAGEFANVSTSDKRNCMVAAEPPLPPVPIAPPQCHTGWLRKKGYFFPSITNRYFTLQNGVLTYYAQDISLIPQGQRRPRPKGSLDIRGYELYSDATQGEIELLLVPTQSSASRRKLWLFCADFMDQQAWVTALTLHCALPVPSKKR